MRLVPPNAAKGRIFTRKKGAVVPVRICVALLLVLLVSCGPGRPSDVTDVTQWGGVWGGNSELNEAFGGGCMEPMLQSRIGSTDTYTIVMTQSGSNVNATVTSPSTGFSAQYSGTIEFRTTLSLTSIGGTAPTPTFTSPRCPNGPLLEMSYYVGSMFVDRRSPTGSNATGNRVEIWNFTEAETRRFVGQAKVGYRLAMTRQ